MAYVGEPFRHDIFVTYSHGDPDGHGNSKLKQWSQAFVRELESELRIHPKLGRDIKVFLDGHHRPAQGIDPMAALTDQLREDIAGAALLAVLMSPHYLRSEWCTEEREWWCRWQHERGLPHDGRIAVARIWTTDDAPWPSSLKDSRGEPLVGFWFFDRETADHTPQPYEWPEPSSTTRDPFRRELLKLVGWLVLKLEELRRRLEEQRRAQQDAAKLAGNGQRIVYLHGRAESDAAWRRAHAALTDSGLVVTPGEPDPVAGDIKRAQRIREQRVETLTACDALLLLAPPDGRDVDSDLLVVGRIDRNSARSRSNRLLPCALLDASGQAIATPERKKTARALNVEWIDATTDPWTPAVEKWLTSAAYPELVS